MNGFSRKQNLAHINLQLNAGGVGDALARLPSVLYLYNNFPHLVLHCWVQSFMVDLFKRSLPVDKNRIIVRDIDKDAKKYNKDLPARGFAFSAYTNFAQEMGRHAFHMLVNTEPSPADLNYLPIKVDDIDISKYNLPEQYVIMPVGFTSLVREFLPEHVNPVIDYIKSKGYEVVFLGNSVKRTVNDVSGYFREDIHWNKGVDLVNKTNLVEATKILYGAKCVLGIDNGILHLAATHPELPIIAGYSTVHSSFRLPYRNGIKGYNCYPIDLNLSKVSCGNCQNRLTMSFDHDFTKCFENPSAKGNEIKCLQYFTPDKWIVELNKIL